MAIRLEIADLIEIGPVFHVEHGQENWYFKAVNAYKGYPEGQKYFVKIG